MYIYITTSNYYDLILDIFIVIVIKVLSFFLERNLLIYDIKGMGDYILFKNKTGAITLIIKHGFDIFVVMHDLHCRTIRNKNINPDQLSSLLKTKQPA